MLDLDNFKVINDTYGHKAGDAVIRKVSNDIRQALRKDDWIARFGGEEFIIWLPNVEARDAIRMAERLRSEAETELNQTN